MSSTLRYLSSADVTALMPPMAEVVDLVQEALRHHGEGNTQMPAKIDLTPKADSLLHAMPAHVAPAGATGMKWVAGYPANKEQGLPYIHGTLVLNDAETGRPLAIMDAGAYFVPFSTSFSFPRPAIVSVDGTTPDMVATCSLSVLFS